MSASLAKPISGRNLAFDIVSIAWLMNRNVTKITNDNKIVVFIFELKTNITLNFVIVIIFWYFHFVEWIKSVLFFLLESPLLFKRNVFVNWKGCICVQITLNELWLDHEVSIKVIQVILVEPLWRASLSSNALRQTLIRGLRLHQNISLRKRRHINWVPMPHQVFIA